MKIHLATDHAGFEYKQAIALWLRSEEYEVQDYGAVRYDEIDDFPDFISKAASAVSKNAKDRAILFGGSGQGEAMMANRIVGVRAAVFYGGEVSIPKLSREHNDSNVLSIGARFVSLDVAKQVIWEWLHTDALTDEKYARRNKKIESYAKKFAGV